MNSTMRYPKGNFLLFFLCVSIAWGQFTIPEKPKKQTSVYDYVNLLSPSLSNALEQKLVRYSDSTSTQIVIAVISSTEGEDINFLGAQWGQKWGIGQADKDNGVLVLLARNDRRIAINTGYGVEGRLTDLMSRRIIETVIIPEFKKGDYYSGLDKGSDAIFKVLTGEFTENRTFGNGKKFPIDALFPIIIFFIIVIILWSRKNKGGGNGGHGGRGPSIWDMIILSNMGRSSGSSGGFGSGGGFSGGGFGGGFGGGGFGGGGASGGW